MLMESKVGSTYSSLIIVQWIGYEFCISVMHNIVHGLSDEMMMK